MKLTKIQAEHAKIQRAFAALDRAIFRSEVLNAEAEERKKKNPETYESPRNGLYDAYTDFNNKLKPIFEKHAGRAAISDAK